MLTSQESQTVPHRMQEATETERLLIWSYRRWVLGMRTHEEGHWMRVWRELNCCFGKETARTILSGLQGIISGIGNHARRSVRIHPPCCGFICPDEMSVVTLVAACQRRNYPTARRIAEWLVRDEGMSGLLEGAGRIASALNANRRYLPDRMLRDTNPDAMELEDVSSQAEKVQYPIAEEARQFLPK